MAFWVGIRRADDYAIQIRVVVSYTPLLLALLGGKRFSRPSDGGATLLLLLARLRSVLSSSLLPEQRFLRSLCRVSVRSPLQRVVLWSDLRNHRHCVSPFKSTCNQLVSCSGGEEWDPMSHFCITLPSPHSSRWPIADPLRLRKAFPVPVLTLPSSWMRNDTPCTRRSRSGLRGSSRAWIGVACHLRILGVSSRRPCGCQGLRTHCRSLWGMSVTVVYNL